MAPKKFQIDIFLLLPATRFHKVKIESQRWKSSIKVYSIPRFIFQWQLASDMIKDVFTLEQKVKWFAGSHYYLMRISHATVFWRSLSIMPRGIIFPSNSICVMPPKNLIFICKNSPKFWIKMIIPLLKIMGPFAFQKTELKISNHIPIWLFNWLFFKENAKGQIH